LCNVRAIETKSPLNLKAWTYYLNTFPDREKANEIMDYIKYGVPIGYEGPQKLDVHPNWPSAIKYEGEIRDLIAKDVLLGRIAGPFSVPPFKYFRGSPLGAFRKRRSNKLRVILDLSWPAQGSINRFIQDSSLQYMSFDDAIKHVRHYGKNCLMAKLDLKDAYKHIVIRPADWHLCGFTLDTVNEQGHVSTDFYIPLVLPFGLKSAPQKFTLFADALQHIMQQRGVTACEHFLDDYFTAGATKSNTCDKNLKIMLDTCEITGFTVNPDKVCEPTTCLEFLGIVIDSNLMQIRISYERLHDTLTELNAWLNKRSVTKRSLLSLIGKLTFICKVVRSGRTFTRRLIECSKRVKHLHHRVRVNKMIRDDIQWWLDYLPTWNGVSVIHDAHWTSNEEISLFSDASDRAIGGLCGNQWFFMAFDNGHSYLRAKSIAYRELYAVVTMLATFAYKLEGKRLLINCDNEAIVHVLQTGTSKNIEIMSLVRTMFYICAQHSMECSAAHVRGTANTAADALSRLDVVKFFKVCPSADKEMTLPVILCVKK
jgi:predicted Zn-ribbon and HTH transcriptional regulator